MNITDSKRTDVNKINCIKIEMKDTLPLQMMQSGQRLVNNVYV